MKVGLYCAAPLNSLVKDMRQSLCFFILHCFLINCNHLITVELVLEQYTKYTKYVSMSCKLLFYFLFQLKRIQINFILNFPMIMHLWVSTKLTLILLIQCRIWEVLKVHWKKCKNIWPLIFFFIIHVLKTDSGLVWSAENIS